MDVVCSEGAGDKNTMEGEAATTSRVEAAGCNNVRSATFRVSDIRYYTNRYTDQHKIHRPLKIHRLDLRIFVGRCGGSALPLDNASGLPKQFTGQLFCCCNGGSRNSRKLVGLGESYVQHLLILVKVKLPQSPHN